MRTDSPGALAGALGIIEDDMAEMLPAYAKAAGFMAKFELWSRRIYLETKAVMKHRGELTHDGLGLGRDQKVTETAIKDAIEQRMREEHVETFKQAEKAAEAKAIGDKLFSGLDARRSIGQTLMKPHLSSEAKYGQEAHGQAGQPA